MKISSWILTALTASDFDKFRRACPSSTVNVWKIKIGSACYLTTPAHVAIYPDKEGDDSDVLYRTPKRYDGDVPDSDDRPVLESMDVGFKGMSGGVAVNEKGKYVGTFVKRGKLIPLKPPRKATVETVSSNEGSPESVAFETVPTQSSWIEKLLFPSRAADIARIDAQFRRINALLSHLNDVVLKKED